MEATTIKLATTGGFLSPSADPASVEATTIKLADAGAVPEPSTDPVSVEATTIKLADVGHVPQPSTDPVSVVAATGQAMKPLYTSANCKAAYQLRWSLALFSAAELPPVETWVDALSEVVERDGVRLLESRLHPPGVLLFLLSTQPPVKPPQVVKSVKGRLQHLLRASAPSAFRRNFSLSSVGDARREAIESYVGSQLGHHGMVDARVQARFKDFQFAFRAVDLSAEQFSSHGRYVYNLHVVLVHDERWREIREDYLATTRDMLFKAARQKGHRLSRLALLPDHLHATLSCSFAESPEEVALGYMNNLAFAHRMQPVFCQSYYVGTFGEYDIRAIRRMV